MVLSFLQVFNTLTEVIQGPCVGNQQTLAHSRYKRLFSFLHPISHFYLNAIKIMNKDAMKEDQLKEADV